MTLDEAAPVADDPRVRGDAITQLYKQSPSALALSVVVAGLWIALMWEAADRVALMGWIAAIALASLARAGLFLMWWKRSPKGPAVLRWEQPFCLSLLPPVLVWGLGSVLVLPEGLLHQVINFVFLMGLSGMAISAYGIFPRLTLLIVTILIAPMSLAWIVEGGKLQWLLAASGVLYLLSITRGVTLHAALVRQSHQLRHQLHDAYRIVEHHAHTDPLTGIANRRAFLVRSEELLQRAVGKGQASTMVLIDLDELKQINDQYGHGAGDAALLHVAEALRASARDSDPCGRLGGDEFALFLPEMTLSQARGVAELLLQRIAAKPLPWQGKELRVQVSVGLANHSQQIEALLHGADSAMYQAKRDGKNRIAVCAG